MGMRDGKSLVLFRLFMEAALTLPPLKAYPGVLRQR